MIDGEERLLLSFPKIERLVKVLSEQRRVLVAAGCDERTIQEYAALIQFLKSATADELHRIFPASAATRKRGLEEPEHSEEKLASLTMSEVEGFISDETTSRKVLERIAIHRFGVPRGSMRSFPNRQLLVEKLLTLLRNEQAHLTIETVARGQGELRGVRPKE